jgi:preprotein translocase subunit SecE
MTTKEDLEKKEDQDSDEQSSAGASSRDGDSRDADDGAETASKAEARSASEKPAASESADSKDSDEEQSEAIKDEKEEAKAEQEAIAALPAAPVQLGYRRFVYAAYFGFGIGVAFIASKLGNQIWYRLSQYKPQWDLGDPQDELIMPIGAVIGGLFALYYYRKQKSRQYVDDVANELSQVTWPNRKEVTNSTAVVIVTTVFATVFFALMDRFWGFVTNLVYGS